MTCDYFNLPCDAVVTHVVHEPEEWLDGGYRVSAAYSRPLCGRHARVYDKQRGSTMPKSERMGAMSVEEQP